MYNFERFWENNSLAAKEAPTPYPGYLISFEQFMTFSSLILFTKVFQINTILMQTLFNPNIPLKVACLYNISKLRNI